MKPALAKRAKAYAKKTNRTFTDLVEEALTDLLDRGGGSSAKLPPLTVVGGGTPLPQDAISRAIHEMDLQDDLRHSRRTG
jgi:hypothetical protein